MITRVRFLTIGRWIAVVVMTAIGCSSLVSCDKDLITTVYGTVTNGNTGAPISDVVMEFSYRELGTTTYSTGYTYLATATTDDQGQYRIAFPNVRATHYRVQLSAAGHFSRSYELGIDEWIASAENAFDAALFAATELWMHVQLEQPGTQMLLRLGEHSIGCVPCCSSDLMTFQAPCDTTVRCQVYGDQVIPYTQTTLKSGSAVNKEGTIDVNSAFVEVFFQP